MRSPSRFGILLVLVIGLLCVGPIKSYMYEDSPEDAPLSSSLSSSDSSPSAPSSPSDSGSSKSEGQSQVEPNRSPKPPPNPTESGDEQGNSKRDQMGMPTPTSARSFSALGADPSEGQVSPPVNEPASNLNTQDSQDLKESSNQEQENKSIDNVKKPESTARGMNVLEQLASPFVGGASQQDINKQVSPPSQIPPENLPKIIENNKLVNPQQQQQKQTSGNHQQKTSVSAPGTALTLPSNNSSLPASSARTLDGWGNCVGDQSNKYGTCKNDVECNKHKGLADGKCMSGFGVCCVMALTCGDKSLENNTFYANPDFPDPSWEARLCEVEVKKKGKHILQVMIEFEEFELAPPNHEGECITDVFQVKLASNRPSPYSLLRICGQNTGQHMYLDVSQIDEPLVLSVATSGGGFPRRWSIRIVQMDEKNFLLAPPGCLQYYTDTVGHFRSFNLGKNLKNLYYAICFRIDNGYSGIRFTDNFFGMNGQFCRTKLGGRNKGSLEAAHPHHLVIPPPGYASPPPKGKYDQPQIGYGSQVYHLQSSPPPPHHLPPHPHHEIHHEHPHHPTHHPGHHDPHHHGRFKRDASLDYNERQTRTHHEHDKDFKEFKEFKEFKHHQDDHYPHHPYPPPPPTYGPAPPQAYGPPPSYGGYSSHEGGYYAPSHKDNDKFDKFDHKFDKFDNKFDKFDDKKDWGWKEKFGLSGKVENKHDSKYGYQSTYAPQYGNQGYSTYGPQQGYGQQGYGQSYGGYGGGYHHKEIDKFGKKYEHLEFKHEKNHLDKDKDKSSSWWPIWSKTDDKKDKKKFDQHHEALFPQMHMREMPHCEPRFCGQNDVITFPPSGDSISEMCGNKFNRGRGPKIISGSPLVVYVSNRGHSRGSGFDMNYEQVFYIPKPY